MAELETEKILAAYPRDRIRDYQTCLRQISTALSTGVEFGDLLRAVKAYASETVGYTRSKVCFSDNWFKMRRWEAGLTQSQADREKKQEAEEKGLASLAGWILDRHPLCRHVTSRQLESLLARRLVTLDQVRAAGLSSR